MRKNVTLNISPARNNININGNKFMQCWMRACCYLANAILDISIEGKRKKTIRHKHECIHEPNPGIIPYASRDFE